MHPLAKVAAAYAVILYLVSGLNYVPGITDEEGRTFGIFALDIYDDALHFASATWAAVSAWLGRRASFTFLAAFGTLYLADGLMGLLWGSGYLDLGIFIYGIQSYDLLFKVFANTPHIVLGGVALASAILIGRNRREVPA